MATLIVGQPTSTEKGGSKERTNSNSQSPSLDSDSEIQITPEYGSYHHHVFANENIAEYWRQKYEDAKYEGRHRFYPTFTWTADEEKRVRRKVSVLIRVRRADSDNGID